MLQDIIFKNDNKRNEIPISSDDLNVRTNVVF